MNKVFEPISDKLICKPVEQDEVSAGGIILPELDDQKTLKAENELSRQRYENVVTSPLRDMLSEDKKAIIELEAAGKMISEGRTSIHQAWWVLVFPLITLFLTVLSFSQLGEGLKDRFDPVLR